MKLSNLLLFAGAAVGSYLVTKNRQAITCALEAHDFEDAVRNAVSLGGDSDTIACMAGAVAEALFGIPRSMANRIRKVIKPSFLSIIDEFEQRFGSNYIED